MGTPGSHERGRTMAKQPTTHDDLALYLDPHRFNNYLLGSKERFTLKIGFVRVNEAKGSETATFQVRNPDTDDVHQQAYNEACISGHCVVELDGLHTYGLEVMYDDLFMVDLRRAEFMVKRKVHNGLAKADFTPHSFGEYCALIARILRVDRLVVRTDDAKHGGFDDFTFSYYSRKQMRDVIDGAVSAFIRKTVSVA